MKKNTYDAISMIAVVILVASTFAAQHFSRAGYLFGSIAILSAVGLFSAYVKALPNRSADQAPNALATVQALVVEKAVQLAGTGDWPKSGGLYSKSKVPEGGRFRLSHENSARRLREHRMQLLFFGDEGHDLKNPALWHSTQIKFHPNPVPDPAAVIANVVEKLCSASKEPRFEFILAPDGSFKIRQMSAKNVSSEPIGPQSTLPKPPGTELVN